MKIIISIRSALIVVFLLAGISFLSACASRRDSRSYVFVPDRDEAVETGQEMHREPQRARRAPRSSARQEPADGQSEGLNVADRYVGDGAAEHRHRSRSEAARQNVEVEVVVVEEDEYEAPARSRRWFGLRRSNRGEAGDESIRWTAHDDTQYDTLGSIDEAAMAPVPRGYRLRAADQIAVSLRGIPEPGDFEFMIPDDGYINMPYITAIQAIGLTISELQRLIHARYVEEDIYRQLSVNVLMATQHYFMRGEVRQPGRFPLTSGMTVIQAIAAAGGYTEFANPRRVEIIRAGETISGNARQMEQNPEDDLLVKAGDVIIVRRSIF